MSAPFKVFAAFDAEAAEVSAAFGRFVGSGSFLLQPKHPDKRQTHKDMRTNGFRMVCMFLIILSFVLNSVSLKPDPE